MPEVLALAADVEVIQSRRLEYMATEEARHKWSQILRYSHPPLPTIVERNDGGYLVCCSEEEDNFIITATGRIRSIDADDSVLGIPNPITEVYLNVHPS